MSCYDQTPSEPVLLVCVMLNSQVMVFTFSTRLSFFMGEKNNSYFFEAEAVFLYDIPKTVTKTMTFAMIIFVFE